MTNKLKISAIAFLISLTLFTCKKDDDSTPPEEPPIDTMSIDTLQFEGVQMTDFNGQPIGCFGGNCSDDWSNLTLTTEELTYLDFVDSLSSTDLGMGVANFVSLYPNPIGNTGDVFLAYETTENLKVKLAIINNQAEILWTLAVNTATGFNNIAIANEALNEVERKEIHRMYYAFYQQNGDIVFSGYGDFSVCIEDFNPLPSSCFQ